VTLVKKIVPQPLTGRTLCTRWVWEVIEPDRLKSPAGR
jgi:hypothetical protein